MCSNHSDTANNENDENNNKIKVESYAKTHGHHPMQRINMVSVLKKNCPLYENKNSLLF